MKAKTNISTSHYGHTTDDIEFGLKKNMLQIKWLIELG